jgi:very-short-patch-repair endonuclease
MRQAKTLTKRAREMRKLDTRAEKHVWVLLRDRRMCGLKFRRQVPVEGYIADFYCGELRLIIELDGGSHHNEIRVREDAIRDRILKEKGYRVLRFSNETVLKSRESFVEAIRRIVQ